VARSHSADCIAETPMAAHITVVFEFALLAVTSILFLVDPSL
jgi:hypothetical protein